MWKNSPVLHKENSGQDSLFEVISCMYPDKTEEIFYAPAFRLETINIDPNKVTGA